MYVQTYLFITVSAATELLYVSASEIRTNQHVGVESTHYSQPKKLTASRWRHRPCVCWLLMHIRAFAATAAAAAAAAIASRLFASLTYYFLYD